MKIGLVCPYNVNKPGGVLQVVLALKAGMEQHGHTVKIITPRPYRSDSIESDDVIYIGTSTDFRSPSHTTAQISSATDNSNIDKILKEENFDILHFHEPWVPFLSRQLLMRSSAINIATFHSKVPETLMSRTVIKVVTPYMKSVMNYLHELTAVSESGAEYARTLTNSPITIIPNGIDLSIYQNIVKTNHLNEKTILFIGRLEHRKGVKYLLKAFALLNKHNQDIKLIIAGDGPNREKLEQIAKDLKLNNVEFLGYISDNKKLELLAEADLFCSPALFGESFGIVLLEAMASRTVTVAGNNSGYIDVMKGLGVVSIVKPQDTDEFARRIELLLNEKDLRKLWLEWAEDYVKQFSYPNVIKQYEQLYQKALKNHSHVKPIN